MKNEISIVPKNSVILIMDRTIGEVPETMSNQLVAFSTSCVAVGTLSEYDGETQISLSDKINESSSCKILAFDGNLETPSKMISICTVLDEPLIEHQVSKKLTRIKIYVNDRTEPNKIRVIIEERQE